MYREADKILFGAELELYEYFPGCVQVFYIPSEEQLDRSGISSSKKEKTKILFLSFNYIDCFVSIYPIVVYPDSSMFLSQKYKTLKSISIEVDSCITPTSVDDVLVFLDNLPRGFVKDYHYGLGLNKDYRFIIDHVENLNKNCLVIGKNKTNNAMDICFYLNINDFEVIRKSIDRITVKARKSSVLVKNNAVYNHIANRLGLEQKTLPTTNDGMLKMLSSQVNYLNSKKVLDVVSKDKESIKSADSATLVKLKTNIELVSLENFILSYKDFIKRSSNEIVWQRFFNENPFVFSLVFGYPAFNICGQASVGGRRFSGSGEKVTDFLVKNGMTNNLAIIEIKKPSTKVVSNNPYRESVYSPSTELTGSIAQVLDQKYQLQKAISSIKENSRLYDIESYAVNCLLIVGMMPEDNDQKKSFEIFRRNLKDVEILTFDELLLKLEQLHSFLSDDTSSEVMINNDVPF
ncbi:MAG: DUF4263 domain-containing protein [Gammaproteobacteria bacterium]|nr:DUF4263 domain-containing protein [Gammaproteobacteria bacterium]